MTVYEFADRLAPVASAIIKVGYFAAGLATHSLWGNVQGISEAYSTMFVLYALVGIATELGSFWRKRKSGEGAKS